MTAFRGSFRVEGLDSLLRKFAAANGKTKTKAVLRKAVRAGGKVSATGIKNRAPVKTGALKKSVKVKARKRSRKNGDSVGVIVTTGQTENLFKGKTFYGAFHEFGTSKTPALGWMRAGFDDTKDDAAKTTGDVVRKEIEKAFQTK